MMVSEHPLVQTPPERTMNVERWGWYSIGVNVVLAAINLIIAIYISDDYASCIYRMKYEF